MIDNCACVNILHFTQCVSYKNNLKLAPYGEHPVHIYIYIYIYIYGIRSIGIFHGLH